MARSYDIYPLDRHQIALIEKYSAGLEAKIVETVGKALADLAPARLAAGQGTAGFAVNRRNNPEPSVPKLIEAGRAQRSGGPLRPRARRLPARTASSRPCCSVTPATIP